jgi:histidine kinase/DNA gyrase B/HSP90-like ATPase
MAATPEEQAVGPLVLKFAGSLVEQLGAQLYPSVTATVAELVSNAWDADAANVWITIPFDNWSPEATIEVLDDGHGMSRNEAQYRYLVVGRNRRREPPGEKTSAGRDLHGRKGIGKLAAFGTAGWLECVTTDSKETTAFAISYEELRKHHPTDDYETEDVPDPDPLVDPEDGHPLEHGTRVRLTKLRAKRRPSESVFRRSMSRRFAISANDMKVMINGEPLARYSHDVEIRFPRDGTPPGGDIEIDDDGWASQGIPYHGKEARVRWWIGFTKTPIPEEDMRGVSVLARGKQAQRPFTFGSSLGTEGQLGQEYLVGEVQADWLDSGISAEEDLIQSNRDQLQLDNEELKPFLEWGRGLVRWALAERNRLRRDRRVGPGSFGPRVEELLESTSAPTGRRLRTLAGRLSEMTDEKGLETALSAIIESRDSNIARDTAAELALDGDPDDEQTWQILRESEESARELVEGQIGARISALERFLIAVSEPPVKNLHNHIADSPWILAPWLDLTPNTVARSDDTLTVVDFEAIGELSKPLRVLAFRPAEQFDIEPYIGELDPGEGAALEVISDSASEARTVGWAQILERSIASHQAWRSALEARGAS